MASISTTATTNVQNSHRLPLQTSTIPSIPIYVESFDHEDVILNNKIDYNTNNHWKENGGPPKDYNEVSAKTYTHRWLHLKEDDLVSSFSININKHGWLIDAYKIGMHTKVFPNAYIDELDALVKEYEHIDFTEPMFIRTENVSLKCGQHGVGPYLNMRMLIESIVTCSPGHAPLDDWVAEEVTGLSKLETCLKEDVLHVYLFRWNTDLKYEYRVFIHNQNLTCISQQHLFDVVEGFTEDLIESHSTIVSEYFKANIKGKFSLLDSYSIDMGILESSQEAYFIEINPFGKEYSSGSSLFHWIKDDEKLCSDGSVIHFRYSK